MVDPIYPEEPEQNRDAPPAQIPVIPAAPRTQMNWEAFIKDLIMKHPKEIKSLVRDLDPDTQAMVFQIIESKYPGYSGIAKMIIGNGNGNNQEREDEDEDEGERGFDTEDLPGEERAPSSSIMKQAIEDAVTMYEAGMPPKEISEQIYSLYELDWSVQAIYRIVTRHQAFKQPTLVKKEEPKPIIAKEPHRGIIRKILHWIW